MDQTADSVESYCDANVSLLEDFRNFPLLNPTSSADTLGQTDLSLALHCPRGAASCSVFSTNIDDNC